MSNIKNLDDYREKLVSKIVTAGTTASALRLLRTAIKTLEQHAVHAHLISRFIEKTSLQLDAMQRREEGNEQRVMLASVEEEIETMRKEKEVTGKYVQA